MLMFMWPGKGWKKPDLPRPTRLQSSDAAARPDPSATPSHRTARHCQGRRDLPPANGNGRTQATELAIAKLLLDVLAAHPTAIGEAALHSRHA